MSSKKVLVVEDSALVREALRSIPGADPDIEGVGIVRDGREVVGYNRSFFPRQVWPGSLSKS